MKTLALIIFSVWLVFSSMGAGMSASAEFAVDHGQFAGLLTEYVHNGNVNYQGFKNHEPRLDEYLEHLGKVDPQTLSRDERFAFYINVYNAWTIKLILSGYPGIRSIKDLGSFIQSPWKKKIVRLGKDTLTLDQIEHEILRPEFLDPRVHFAINCAARSCPPLRHAPFTGAHLTQQLDNAAAEFINDPKSNRISGNTLYVSRIFKWFAEDFNHDVPEFFLKYATGNLKKELENKRDVLTVKYLKYDWSLNGN